MKKKRIPECNDAYKNALIKKVLDADVVYEWDHVLIDKHRWLSCIPGIFLGGCFCVFNKGLLGYCWCYSICNNYECIYVFSLLCQ